MASVSPSFTKSFKSSYHFLAGLPALLRGFVEMMSPGFHSAAFLVHLSWLCAAIRRAWRDFNFFCLLLQFVTLSVSIFSSASFVFFFMYSIQSSGSSSWLAVLSSSSVLVVFIICAVYYLSILASFVVTNLFFSRFLLLYFLFVWMMSRSILRCAFFRVLLLLPMSRHRALL